MRMTVRGEQFLTVSEDDMAEQKAPHGVAGAPNEQALLALMDRTGYSMIQENGQRKYGGPPPHWEGPAPQRGCEVFVGKIPRDCYEDELVPVFERIGRIYELRLMMDFSGANRGYCFVMYTSRDDAKRAVKELNNYQIRKGRYLGVCLSVDNCRLFVGGIPKNKTKEEILVEMNKVTDGVVDVIVYPSATDKTKNRGFAFVEYESHRAAAMARRKLIPGRIQLWGHTIAVDWAEPEQEVDEEVMSKVKILYVRNLMLSTTEEALERLFNQATGKESAVERVKKIRDYAFVHFRDRDDCLLAQQVVNGTAIEGSQVEVTLAKPVDKNDYVRYTRGVGSKPAFPQQTLTTTLPYPYSTGMENNPYFAAGIGLPGYYAAAPGLGTAATTPAAAAAAASLAAGGLQNRTNNRGALRGRGRGAAGSRGAGGVTRSYVPGYLRGPGGTHRKMGTEDRLYDIQPHMEILPTNPITLKPHNVNKSTIQILEEFCQKNGWGSPIYQLHSAMGGASGDVQLFLFKVSIPALASHYPNSSFQPNKLCRSVDEAKNFAAEYVLMHLGVPYEGAESQQATTLAAQQLTAQQLTAQQLTAQQLTAQQLTAQQLTAPHMTLVTSSPAAVSPPPTAMQVATPNTALYQGRPIVPASANYASMANGGSVAAAAALAMRGDLYTTTAPSTASYVMSPGKLPTPPAQSIHPQSYPFAAPMAGF